MARYRSRSRSRSYSPRRYSRSPPPRKRYDDPRDRDRDRYRRGGGGGGGGGGGRYRGGYGRPSGPSGLLVRNISLSARSEDLRVSFERFGPIKDIYLPRNFYTKEPRGFGFIKFRYADDAALAKQEMNHQVIGGREISIVFAEENRKTPQEMRLRTRFSDRHMDGNHRRRSLSRSPRPRFRSYSHSPSPVRRDSRDMDRDYCDYYSPERSYSPRPREERYYGSSRRSPSPEGRGRRAPISDNGRGPPVERSPTRSRSYSPR